MVLARRGPIPLASDRHEQAHLLVTLLAHRHEPTVPLARSAVDLDQMFRPPLRADFHHGLLSKDTIVDSTARESANVFEAPLKP
jgi:hypothetical protein